MLVKVLMRVTKKDKKKEGKEITDYLPSLLQTDSMTMVMDSGIPGVLSITMINGSTHLVRAEVDDFEAKDLIKEKKPKPAKPAKKKPKLKVVKGKGKKK